MNYVQEQALDLIIQYIQDNKSSYDDVLLLVEDALSWANNELSELSDA